MQPSSPLFLFMRPREYKMSEVPESLHCTTQCSPIPCTGAAGQKRVAGACFPSFRKHLFASQQQQDFLAGGCCQVASVTCGITAGSTAAIRQKWIQNPGSHAQARAMQSRLCATSGLPRLATLISSAGELQKQRIISGFDHFEMPPSKNTGVTIDAQVDVNMEKLLAQAPAP